MAILITIIIIFLSQVIFVIVNYDSMVRLSLIITESWLNMNTELRKRYNLTPNLVEQVKGDY